MSVQRVKLGFGTDLAVEVPSHLCLFYKDDAELRERLGFLRAALEDPAEVAVLFGKRSRLEEVLGYLAADHGRDVEADLSARRIVLVEGDPDANVMLARIGAEFDAILARGARLIRFLGFIGWGDMDWPSDADLLAFEAKVNDAVGKYPAVVLCTYGLEHLPSQIIVYGGIETHPFTILGTTLCRNPHYVPFEEYLARQDRDDPAGRRKALGKVVVGPV